MKQSVVHIALVVKDYDEAIDFYTKTLDFNVHEDTYIAEQDKRWVLITPPNSEGCAGGCAILLARASNEEQERFIGDQAGGRVFLFLSTDNFWRDYENYIAKGVTFIREPTEFDYGTVAVFEDLYGNKWDLIQHKSDHPFAQSHE